MHKRDYSKSHKEFREECERSSNIAMIIGVIIGVAAIAFFLYTGGGRA